MTLGVTVLPEWAQSEGIEPLLDRLQQAHVTDIATSPYVMEPAATGTREPPADAGAGKVRLLDRPLWGQRELYVRTAPSFTPDTCLYASSTYCPPAPDDLTAREGDTVQRFIAAARLRGMKVWFQVQSAIPPGYRVQFGGPHDSDVCLGPNELPGPARVDKNASLAAPDVIAYGRAMLQDLAKKYPAIEGIRLDWPEYPPYAFHSLFFDFSAHALRVADSQGLDVERMRHDALRLHQRLTSGLTSEALAKGCYLQSNSLAILLKHYPGMLDLMTLRRHLSMSLIRQYRDALPASLSLVPQAFPPPFNLLSGFDYTHAGELVQGIGVKLYTMHWPMIVADYAKAMSAGTASETEIARALVTALGVCDKAPDRLAEFRYPEPHENHAASSSNIQHKIVEARKQAGTCPVYAFTHGYGPLADMTRRAQVAWQASEGKMWVNRYGYLSDQKLAALGVIARS